MNMTQLEHTHTLDKNFYFLPFTFYETHLPPHPHDPPLVVYDEWFMAMSIL